MCIYYGNKNDLHYTQREHIFSAFLGGKTKLDLGVVSDEANHILSVLENELAHKSILQIPRGFLGPGKRGGENKNNLIVYPIQNLSQNIWGLGYIFLGKCDYIPHVVVRGEQWTFSCQKSNTEKVQAELELFLQELKGFEKSPFTRIEIQLQNPDFFMIGYYQKKWYVYTGKLSIEEIYLRVKRIIGFDGLKRIDKKSFQPKIHGCVRETKMSNRVYAKIAFEVLTYYYGEQFVLNKNFDSFRKWIITGIGNDDNYMSENILPTEVSFDFKFPEDSHWCLLVNKGNMIYAVVTLYNKLSRKYEIGQIPKNMNFRLCGMICDWKNKEEYSLDEWINKYVRINHSRLEAQEKVD